MSDVYTAITVAACETDRPSGANVSTAFELCTEVGDNLPSMLVALLPCLLHEKAEYYPLESA